MAIHAQADGKPVGRLRDAVLTLVAVVLAFLALDDITTDRASSFVVERVALAGCGLWFALLALRLVQQGQRALGLSSIGVVIALAVAQPGIGPGTIPGTPASLAMVLGLAWFLLMSGTLAVRAVRAPARRADHAPKNSP